MIGYYSKHHCNAKKVIGHPTDEEIAAAVTFYQKLGELKQHMHILFLCCQNKRRSLTAEKLFDGYKGHQARSAGTENNSRIKVTPGLLGWADIIFCMEKKHIQRIKEKYPEIVADKKIVCLNISDEYSFMDNYLCELLEAVVPENI